MVVDEAKKELSLEERDAAIEEIAARLGVRAERGRRFAELTSLRVGGAIDWVISPTTEEQAAKVVYELDEAGIPWRALGSGSNVLETVRVARGGHVVEIPGSEVKWDYRHTSFREGELLLGATLLLQRDDPEKIGARMLEAKNKRLATQPHGARSAGCFFKNPPGSEVGTGKMIDEMGMKGERRGGALVSPIHANFIVTEGEDAKAEDALALAEE